MKIIRFNHVKKRAIEEFVAAVGLHNCMSKSTYEALIAAVLSSPPRKPREVLEEWLARGIEIIERWDIRRVMKLVELFPGCLSKDLHGRRPVCDYDERGNWVLVFE